MSILAVSNVLAANGFLNFINNVKAIAVAAIVVIAIIKLAPQIFNDKPIKLVTTLAVVSVIVYFSMNPDAFNSVGQSIANLFK